MTRSRQDKEFRRKMDAISVAFTTVFWGAILLFLVVLVLFVLLLPTPF